MTEKRQLVRNITKDISRLIGVANAAGFELTNVNALWVWDHHSRTVAAQDWVAQSLYTDEQLLKIMKLHLLDRPNA